MKYWYLSFYVAFGLIGASCSHYVGLPDDPNSVNVDNQIDEIPRIFLSITAQFEELDDRWAISMRAKSGPEGKEVDLVKGATLSVNGEARNLLYGFPYRGTPERLFLSSDITTLAISYRSPRNLRSATSFQLGQQPQVVGTPTASRAKGLEVEIEPKLRPDETLIARIYESSSGRSRLLRTVTYDDDLRSFISFNAADYAAEITNGEELILQISRTIKTKRSALFSDGVELNVVFAEFNRYVPVVE